MSVWECVGCVWECLGAASRQVQGGEIKGGEMKGGEIKGGEIKGGEVKGGEIKGECLIVFVVVRVVGLSWFCVFVCESAC